MVWLFVQFIQNIVYTDMWISFFNECYGIQMELFSVPIQPRSSKVPKSFSPLELPDTLRWRRNWTFLFWISKVVTDGEWKTNHTWRWKSVRKKSSFKTFNERKDFFFSSHSDKRIEEKKFRLRKHLSKKIPSIKCICGTCNPIWKRKMTNRFAHTDCIEMLYKTNDHFWNDK